MRIFSTSLGTRETWGELLKSNRDRMLPGPVGWSQPRLDGLRVRVAKVPWQGQEWALRRVAVHLHGGPHSSLFTLSLSPFDAGQCIVRGSHFVKTVTVRPTDSQWSALSILAGTRAFQIYPRTSLLISVEVTQTGKTQRYGSFKPIACVCVLHSALAPLTIIGRERAWSGNERHTYTDHRPRQHSDDGMMLQLS